MTNEAKIVLFGTIAIVLMIGMLIFISPRSNPANKETNCRTYLATTTDRSLEEIQQLCKQP